MRRGFPGRSARALVGSLALLGGLAVAPSLRADEPELTVHLECAHANGPGRILCDLGVSASVGKLVWVDALVVRAPRFARPLRSRVVAQIGATGAASAKLALVASELGEGELELRVRAVLCREGASGQSCAPSVRAVTAAVSVAPPAP